MTNENKPIIKIKNLAGLRPGFFEEYLSEDCILEESESPDFVLCNPNTLMRALKYDCVRIWICGENVRPDFNLVDYAVGFDDMTFGDRYLQLPLYAYGNAENLYNALHRHEDPQKRINTLDRHENPNGEAECVTRPCGAGEPFASRLQRDFCDWIVSNGDWNNKTREHIFEAVCKYKKVNSAGRYLNNMPEGWILPIEDDPSDFHAKHKFSLALENSQMPGYTTEKLVDAFAGGGVPIYWGDPAVKDVFNEKAFVCVMDFPSLEAMVEHVAYLDQNDEAYLAMLREPAFRQDGPGAHFLEKRTLRDFLVHAMVEQTPAQALRRLNKDSGWGAWDEQRCKEYENLRSHGRLYSVLRRLWKL